MILISISMNLYETHLLPVLTIKIIFYLQWIIFTWKYYFSGNSYQGGHQGSGSSGSGTDMRTDRRTDVHAELRTDLRSQLDLEQEKAFKQSKQFAQLFKIKPEATEENFKRRRLDPSEVSEVEYRRIVGGGNLPLSVEIDELENSSESISPHAQRYFFTLIQIWFFLNIVQLDP